MTVEPMKSGLSRFVLSAFIRYYPVLQHFGAKNLLASKHYPEQVLRAIDYALEDNAITGSKEVTLIIDSGAFSVWNVGGKLNIDEYIDFLVEFDKNHKDKFKEVFYVNLDVIPGSKSDTRITEEMIDKAAKEGFDNYELMKNVFDNIIHVYHQGDDIAGTYWLDKLLNTNPAYIGISPSNAVMTQERKLWLDAVFKKVPPHVRTHGFAVTSIDLMNAYNWFSVDSTSWFMIGMYGKLCVPLTQHGALAINGLPIYQKFEVSTSPQKIHSVDGYMTYLEKSTRHQSLITTIDKYITHLCKTLPMNPRHIFSHRNEGRVMANLNMFLQFENQERLCQYEVNSMF